MCKDSGGTREQPPGQAQGTSPEAASCCQGLRRRRDPGVWPGSQLPRSSLPSRLPCSCTPSHAVATPSFPAVLVLPPAFQTDASITAADADTPGRKLLRYLWACGSQTAVGRRAWRWVRCPQCQAGPSVSPAIAPGCSTSPHSSVFQGERVRLSGRLCTHDLSAEAARQAEPPRASDRTSQPGKA